MHFKLWLCAHHFLYCKLVLNLPPKRAKINGSSIVNSVARQKVEERKSASCKISFTTGYIFHSSLFWMGRLLDNPFVKEFPVCSQNSRYANHWWSLLLHIPTFCKTFISPWIWFNFLSLKQQQKQKRTLMVPNFSA